MHLSRTSVLSVLGFGILGIEDVDQTSARLTKRVGDMTTADAGRRGCSGDPKGRSSAQEPSARQAPSGALHRELTDARLSRLP